MSTTWSGRTYGLSGLSMDWYGLEDPFRIWLPIEFSVNGTGLFFQGDLSGLTSGFTVRYAGYSGIQMGLVSGPGTWVRTLRVNWTFGYSGATSPYSDTLTARFTAYVSSNYTGSVSGAIVMSWPAVWFNRDSHIRLFGDDYSQLSLTNIQVNGDRLWHQDPRPALNRITGGYLAAGQGMNYAISCLRSGFESFLSTSRRGSGADANDGWRITWSLAEGATQYFVWRWSGVAAPDFGWYSGENQSVPGSGYVLRPMDLIGVTTTNLFDDTTANTLRANRYRHRAWQRMKLGTTSQQVTARQQPTYETPHQALELVEVSNPASNPVRWSQGFPLTPNLSGGLSGPYFLSLHVRGGVGFAVVSGSDAKASGTLVSPISNYSTSGVSGLSNTMWARHCFALQPGASGIVHFHILQDSDTALAIVDDVYVVAFS